MKQIALGRVFHQAIDQRAVVDDGHRQIGGRDGAGAQHRAGLPQQARRIVACIQALHAPRGIGDQHARRLAAPQRGDGGLRLPAARRHRGARRFERVICGERAEAVHQQHLRPSQTEQVAQPDGLRRGVVERGAPLRLQAQAVQPHQLLCAVRLLAPCGQQLVRAIAVDIEVHRLHARLVREVVVVHGRRVIRLIKQQARAFEAAALREAAIGVQHVALARVDFARAVAVDIRRAGQAVVGLMPHRLRLARVDEQHIGVCRRNRRHVEDAARMVEGVLHAALAFDEHHQFAARAIRPGDVLQRFALAHNAVVGGVQAALQPAEGGQMPPACVEDGLPPAAVEVGQLSRAVRTVAVVVAQFLDRAGRGIHAGDDHALGVF